MNGDINVKVTIEKREENFKFAIFHFVFKILLTVVCRMVAAQFSFLMIMALVSVCVMMCHNK